YVHEEPTVSIRGEVEESGTSNSSVVNTEGCSSSNVGDDDSVSVAESFHCFNFDILKVGDTGVQINTTNNDEGRTSPSQTRSEFVTRTLFPVSHEEGRFNLGQQMNSLLLFPNNNINNTSNNEGVGVGQVQVQQNKPIVQVGKKSRRGPRSRSSQYRGVTFYRRTGRWESHIWDCGKQVYLVLMFDLSLGGFDTAHAAARAYDRAAIKFRGVDADINFNVSDYEEDMNQIKNLSKEDFVHLLRRHSNGFSRGGSKYRGMMMMNNKCGQWESPMGQFLGRAYDKGAIKSNAYEGEAIASSHCGNRHNLDLNLCISTPSCHGNGSSRHENLGHMQLNHGVQDIRRSLHAGNPSTATLQGLPLISEHGQSWTAIYHPQINIAGSSQGPSNLAWQQLHGQSQNPSALLTAASSGFPAPAATNSLNYK
ncbi:hypothetical protein M8C21_024166, partial [Ambrosia artemisiifolia]